MKNTGLDDYSIDIGIFCLSLWGSNWEEYLQEANRIIDTNGLLLIVEPYKRWNIESENGVINRLEISLEKYGFAVRSKTEGKFMFLECRKK